MFELSLKGIKKYLEGHLILKNISFDVYAGEKVGIVGENGGGKSTILKLIAGIEPMHYWPGYPQTSSPGYDEGLIHLPNRASAAYLQQIPDYPEGVTVMDVLNQAFEEVRELETNMRQLEKSMKVLEGEKLQKALKQYSSLTEAYEAKGGYQSEEKLQKIITGLQFDDGFLQKDFSILSGGEKTTVVLGKLLIDQPDILLLDEPTNHLDLQAIQWLEGYLKNYDGIVLVVSHDRYFLDHVVTKIVEVEGKKSITYKGNYSAYAAQRAENLRIQYEQYCEEQKRIRAMEDQVKQLRDWAIRADNNKFFKRAASIQTKLEKMDRIQKPVMQRKNMRLDINGNGRSGKQTILAESLTKGYEEKEIFKNTDLLISYGEKVALIGPNGSGKTTFFKMLLGEEPPDQGSVKIGEGVRAAYLPQEVAFHNENLTVLDCFREDLFIDEGKAREYLARFMFQGNSVFETVKHLSGGEKIRLKLARMLYEDINLIILDEPTNHLDIASIERFEEVLKNFKGTVLFISHDRYFINEIAQRLVAIENRGFTSYIGNYEEYKAMKDQERRKEQEMIEIQEKPTGKAKKSKKLGHQKKRRNGEREKAKLEALVERLEREIAEIDEAMTTIGSDYEKLSELYGKKETLNQSIEKTMEQWATLEG
ncbi:ribosomal protection-like ABC-F family protein [Isachenkonia alkalipeptolytica]|uniref:ABC-F family ATP-binding cassette domain-containing protein n=1 Tax=Isachenkonia alkalipeptolytica TaxID=2565777 RepID=A0AA43XJU9_9CLOT|nr:ABC-F family ATP-binding cassette domain-containing protein [Isachenkonia alkalipeptolytica]NBG88208.1 ABC-F family ATP-binding cassette domain-containing protein [Isachenkonia alkalipeptolytica]